MLKLSTDCTYDYFHCVPLGSSKAKQNDLNTQSKLIVPEHTQKSVSSDQTNFFEWGQKKLIL